MAVGLKPIILHRTPMLDAVTPLPMPLNTPPGGPQRERHTQMQVNAVQHRETAVVGFQTTIIYVSYPREYHQCCSSSS